MGDAYLRTGRGGAGNFYSQKDVEDTVTKDRAEDIEAQKPAPQQDSTSTTPSTPPPTSAAAGGVGGVYMYARSGRGGAGNFIQPSSPTHPISIPISTPILTSTSPPPPSKSAQSPPGPSTGSSRYSGRGGAGNWAGPESGESEGTQRAKEEQERRRKEALLDAGIAREIRASLPQQPPRTYHLHEPGRGRRPEVDA
ncbi:hypothetical protein F5Y12DRAFT_712640 [Xylaria sp. FL1777]|nr:hypothetical protein F5Y12DRAFT_712640 [Xylaria sp. FL1777]